MRNDNRYRDNEIEMVHYSFGRDFAFVCSVGLNIGFIIALMFL